MNIVFISTSAIPAMGADGIHLIKMCSAFASLGHDVSLIVPNRKEVIEKETDDIFGFYDTEKNFRILKHEIYYIRHIGRMLFELFAVRTLNRIQPDLVYSTDLIAAWLSAMNGYKTFLEIHQAPVKLSVLKKFLFKRLDVSNNFIKFITITSALSDYISDQFGINQEKLLVLPSAFYGSNPRSVTTKKPSNDRLQVGYIGSLFIGKGMEIISRLPLYFNNIDFHVVGGNASDLSYWKQRINYKNLYFHGYIKRSNLPEQISRLDICLLPNQRKVILGGGADIGKYTSPLKMFEYMAYGKAIIASDIPVLREVLDETNSILVDPDDIDGWCNAISELMDKKRRDQLGSKAYQDYLNHYTVIKRIGKILNAAGI